MSEFTPAVSLCKAKRNKAAGVQFAQTTYEPFRSVSCGLIEMVICYLGLGSNIGSRQKNIKKALDYLSKTKGIKIEKASRIYETKPQGGPPQNKFLNAAVKINTSLSPQLLLKAIKKIEKDLGRKPTVRFGPREIDLDILLYGNRIVKRKNLIIPHPRMFEREFVLRPLREVI